MLALAALAACLATSMLYVVWLQVGANTPNFNQMVGNPLAKQIPWDTNPTTLAAWREGNTGEDAPVSTW
jgi:hypothetical protein